jgi:tRNA pseudouridine32 synthase/23S rRNA pseudouridine746 synthase
MSVPDPSNIPILYQDADLLVINKPAGLLTIEDGYHAELPNLRQMLKLQYGDIWIVHRLDRDTSGVLVVARNKPAFQSLNQQFEQRLITKTYHALVAGIPTWQSISINLPLRVNGDRSHRTVVSPLTGKPALTDFQLLRTFSNVALVEAHPHTGYTHQIRAHLLAAGFPILSDSLYGPKDLQPGQIPLIPRMALHAMNLQLTHPDTHQPCSFTSPYPDDFLSAIHLLSTDCPSINNDLHDLPTK